MGVTEAILVACAVIMVYRRSRRSYSSLELRKERPGDPRAKFWPANGRHSPFCGVCGATWRIGSSAMVCGWLATSPSYSRLFERLAGPGKRVCETTGIYQAERNVSGHWQCLLLANIDNAHQASIDITIGVMSAVLCLSMYTFLVHQHGAILIGLLKNGHQN